MIREHDLRGTAGKRRGTCGSGPIRVAGVSVSSPDRVVYPDADIMKGDLAHYWEAMAEIALPHLRDRPLTLVRCPEGIGKPCFFQKHATDAIPETVGRVIVPEKTGEDKPERYMLLDSPAALLALVQVGVVEFHVWQRARGPARPAGHARDRPRPRSRRTVAGRGVRHGDRFVTTASKDARDGRVYVDHLRNGRNATAIGTFSPRARSGAPVALPLTWTETEALEVPLHMSMMEVAEIDWAARDPWAGFHDVRQSITKSVRDTLRV